MPYYGLASGFLTGKYRDGGAEVDSPRAEGAAAYLDDRGRAVLAALDEIAAGHGAGRGGRRWPGCGAADGGRADRQRPHHRAVADLLPVLDWSSPTTRCGC